jgi:cell wall-associated NlpC family hydrolase
MTAILDRYVDVMHMSPSQKKVVEVALICIRSPYEYGAKNADPAGFLGLPPGTTDCSGFVRRVFHEVFPIAGLLARDDLSVATFAIVDLFVDIDSPASGDIVLWTGHIGIVVDPTKRTFIGAQTSTGVAVASYASGYWASHNGGPKKFRKWKSLP